MARSRTIVVVCSLVAVVLALALAHLTNLGPWTVDVGTAPPDRIRYPIPNRVGTKFDPVGNALPFNGNTIISRLSNSSDLSQSLFNLQAKLKNSPSSHLIAHLPQSSWHMSVFEGAVAIKRKPWHWPSDLPLDATVEECTALFRAKLSSFALQLALPLRLSVVGFASSGVGIHLQPHPDDARQLRHLRDRLADLLKMRNPRAHEYEFHISIGYLLRYLTDDQRVALDGILMGHFSELPKEVEMKSLEFCAFENMLGYDCVLELKNEIVE